MKEQRLVVDLDVAGQQAAEVLHIPERAEIITVLSLAHFGPPGLTTSCDHLNETSQL